jgi:hypothetical protein
MIAHQWFSDALMWRLLERGWCVKMAQTRDPVRKPFHTLVLRGKTQSK